MPIRRTDEQIRQLRLRAQGLTIDQAESTGAAGVVRRVCGIQAQDPGAAALAIRARSVGLFAEDIVAANDQARAIVRTWAMRGTLHLVAAEDLGWLIALLGPIAMAASTRRRKELGLDDDLCARGLNALRVILAAHGPATRMEIVDGLAKHAIVLDPQSQAPYHLIRHAALAGLLCLGPDRPPGEPTYVLVEDWIGAQQPRPTDLAQAELARRYLLAYAPAELEDFATWAGIPMSMARAAWTRLADQLVEVPLEGRSGWMLASQAAQLDEPSTAPSLTVRLLPSFDTYLLGYRNRELLVPTLFAPRINRGGGILNPVVLVDGRAVGTWRQQKRRVTQVVVFAGPWGKADPFERLNDDVLAALTVEVTDLARFLHRETRLSVHTGAPG